MTVFVHTPWVGLLSCAVCGFSVSLMWPGTLSLTAAAYPRGGTAMFGFLAVFGDLGGAIGPWLAGFASDLAQNSSKLIAFGTANNLNPEQVGLKSGLLLAIIFPVAVAHRHRADERPDGNRQSGTRKFSGGTRSSRQ